MTNFEIAMLSFLQDAQNEFNSEKEVEHFIEKHRACCNTIDEYDRHVETDRVFEPFDLIYENDPDFALGENYVKKNREKIIKELDNE